MNLQDVLERVRVEEPVSWNNLQVFPLMQPNGHPRTYALLDDLLEREQVEITELDEGGHVPTIKVRNRADVDALILDGTELRGAKQNRMVNITIIVGKHSEAPIPVTCVEQGRWSYRSQHFSSAGRTVGSKLRNLKAHMVSEHLSRAGAAQADQGGVWNRVADYIDASSASSATAAMDDVFAQREGELDEMTARLRGIEGVGAVVALNGEIIALDLVDHVLTFEKLWQGLLRGYALDAALEPATKRKPLTWETVEEWLGSVAAKGTLTAHEVPGVGEYHAVCAPGLAGGLVIHQGRPVHVALFPVRSAERWWESSRRGGGSRARCR